MADFGLPTVTDLESAKTLISQIADEFTTMSASYDADAVALRHGHYTVHPDDNAEESALIAKSTAYDFAAQRMRDILFQFES